MRYAVFYEDLVYRSRARPPNQVYRKLKLYTLSPDARARIQRKTPGDLGGTTARLTAGTYGRCECCDERITADRPTARPTTTTCMRCANARR